MGLSALYLLIQMFHNHDQWNDKRQALTAGNSRYMLQAKMEDAFGIICENNRETIVAAAKMGFFLSLCTNGKGFYGNVDGTWLAVIAALIASWLGQLPAPLFQELPQGFGSITAPIHGDTWWIQPASRHTNFAWSLQIPKDYTSLLCPNDLSNDISPYKVGKKRRLFSEPNCLVACCHHGTS